MTRDGQAKIAIRAKGSLESLFIPEDYPREVWHRPTHSDGQFLLLVNEHGRVEGCHVLHSTGSPAVDTAACSIYIRRAKFSPARDAAGKPMRDTVVTSGISWGY